MQQRAGINNISVGNNCDREQFSQTVNGCIIMYWELIDGFEVKVIVAQFWANQIGCQRVGHGSRQPDNRPIDSNHR